MLKGSKIFTLQAKISFRSDCLLKFNYSNKGIIKSSANSMIKSSILKTQEYPPTEKLPLPSNIEELPATQKLRFSPLRNRDITGSFISSSTSSNSFNEISFKDDKTELYDCSGTINLSSTMQTNVPIPFSSKGKPTHLNMPGGQWRQNDKYTSDDLNKIHHINSKFFKVNTGSFHPFVKKGKKHTFIYSGSCEHIMYTSNLWSGFKMNQIKAYCTTKKKIDSPNENLKNKVENHVPQLSQKDKFKTAVRDYGAVVIVFHVGISLISLGCCYLAVASGVDLSSILAKWGMKDEGAATAGSAAQFIIAYTIHKTMAPVRFAITLTAAPFVVKKLRKMGFLKPPKSKTV